MGMLTYYTYNDEPPIPAAVKDPTGNVLFTRADILAGQSVFLSNGLMEYGSIFGHGAYLGPDFTAEYLHRAALSSIDYYSRTDSSTAQSRTLEDFKANRYNATDSTLIYSAAQTHAFNQNLAYYASFFGEPTTKFGLRPSAIHDPEQIHNLVAFFSWTAWAASATRPGHTYSYTNNWPPESLVNNHLTADAVVWSMLSLAALLAGTGLLFAAFGRWNLLGWHGREQQSVTFRAPDQSGAYSGAACLCMVFLRDGGFVRRADNTWGCDRTLSRRLADIFRHRPGTITPFQRGTDVASTAIDFLGFYFLPCGWDLPGSHGRRPGTSWPKASDVCIAGRTCDCGRGKPSGRVRRHSGFDSQRLALATRALSISTWAAFGRFCLP